MRIPQAWGPFLFYRIDCAGPVPVTLFVPDVAQLLVRER